MEKLIYLGDLRDCETELKNLTYEQIFYSLEAIFTNSKSPELFKAYFKLNTETDFYLASKADLIAFIGDFLDINRHGANGGTHGLIYCQSMDEFFESYADYFYDLIDEDEILSNFIKLLDPVEILSGVRWPIVQCVAELLSYELCESTLNLEIVA